jgi:chitodextrinase
MLGAAPTSTRRRMSVVLVALSGAFAVAATASASDPVLRAAPTAPTVAAASQIHAIEINTALLPAFTPAFVRQLKASGVNLFVTAAQRLSTPQRTRIRKLAAAATLTPVPHRKPGLLTTVKQAKAACHMANIRPCSVVARTPAAAAALARGHAANLIFVRLAKPGDVARLVRLLPKKAPVVALFDILPITSRTQTALAAGIATAQAAGFGIGASINGTTQASDQQAVKTWLSALPSKTTAAADPPSTADVLPPTAPLGVVRTSATSTTVTLGWTAAIDNVGVAGYDLFRDGQSVGSTTLTSFDFTGLACGTSFAFGVSARDAAGNSSPRVTVSASTAACGGGGGGGGGSLDTSAPTTPTALVRSAVTQTAFTVSWNASADNVGVLGYGIYLAGAGAGSANSTSFTVTGLSCGTTYAVAVDAFDGAGNRSAKANLSTSTSACPAPDTQAPTVPGSLSSPSRTTTSVSLSWNASTDNVGVLGYGIYLAGAGAGSANSNSFSVTGLTCGTTYAFAVDAFDGAGNRSAKANLSAATAACPPPGSDTQAPTVPASLSAPSNTTTSVSLSWSASTDNVGVSGYGVYRNGSSAGSTSSTSFTVTGLTCGTIYAFAVDAVDAAGNRSTKANLSAATAACPPPPPDTQAPTVPGSLISASTTASVSLSWSASTDNVGVTGYGVYLAGANAGSTSSTSFTIAGLTCGTTYAFAVDAVDAAGNRSTRANLSAATASCPPPPDTQAPTVPGAPVSTSATTVSVSLSWTASTDNVGVTGYGVYNGASSTGSTSATTYTVSGLACGSSYTLGIDAVDAAGNRSVKATVAATTAACSGSGTADFYVSPSGSDSGSCTQVAPCKTFARAFTVAPAGSVVQAADGYYGCPSISGSKSSDVTFRAAPGALPWTTCEQNISAQHIAFENMNFAGFRMGESGRYITLRNVNIACEDQAPFTLYGGLCSAGLFGAPSDFSFLGGSVGPTYDNDVYHTPGNSQLGIPYGGGPYGSTNIVLDGVRFHDNRKAAGAHTECLMVGGGTNFTIRNSKFENCNIYDIYFTWWNFVTPAYPVASNILLENNWFENPTEVAQAVRFGDYMGSFNNITVRNNSSTGDLSIGDSPKSNVQFVGNVADKASYACTSGVVYSHNVWTGAKCGATDKTAPSGFVNAATFDYHLATGSAAINAGDPANYSATDIDGQARPLGGIPDAGADESQ